MLVRAPIAAVSFDFGQTLCSIDPEMLSRRLAERGISLPQGAVEPALDPAWRAYSDAIRAGHGGHPWSVFMATLLQGAGLHDPSLRRETVEWLWQQQPSQNLWRKPIEGMIELVRDLRREGVPVGVLSNSEGKLAELITELGWSHEFVTVADSGRLGVEKPDRAIFAWTAEKLGVPMSQVVHIGDAWAADFEGALAAGMHAVLFRGRSSMPEDATFPTGARADRCETATELRFILRRWGLKV